MLYGISSLIPHLKKKKKQQMFYASINEEIE